MERIIADNWGVLMSAPLAFAAALCFGVIIGWIVIGLIYSQRLTHYQELIGHYRDVIDGKFPSTSAPPRNRMSFGLVSVGLGIVAIGLIMAAIGVFWQP